MANNRLPKCSLSNEEVLFHLLKKEYEYYKSILNLSEKEQAILLSNQSTQDLQPILKRKKVVLSYLHDLELALTPLKKSWYAKNESKDLNSLKIKELIADLQLVLKKILQIDQINQKLLKNKIHILKDNIARENTINVSL